jgi:polyisoprenoid-binding protein YceI
MSYAGKQICSTHVCYCVFVCLSFFVRLFPSTHPAPSPFPRGEGKVALFGVIIALLITSSFFTFPAQAEPAKYYVAPQQFNAAFQIMDMGFSNLFGLFQSATGGFTYDADTKTISHVRLALDASSLMTSNPANRRDLAQLFATRQYPEISFLATSEASFKDGKAEVKGTLNVHGVAKPMSLEATLNQAGKSPRGGGMWNSEGEAVGLSLRGSFKRADLGMGDEPEMPGRFGDTITLLLEMQAIRQ